MAMGYFSAFGARTMAALAVLGILALLAPLPTAAAQPSVPDEPVNVTATPGDAQVTLAWTPGADNGSTIIRYEYTYDENGAAVNVWYPIPGSNRHTTSYTVTGLANGTAYRFYLRAINLEGNGAVATAVSLPAIPATTPDPVTELIATPGNSQATLTWIPGFDGGSPILYYEIRQRIVNSPYGPWSIMVGSTAATTSFIVTGLTNGVTYQFQVRAVNAIGPTPVPTPPDPEPEEEPVEEEPEEEEPEEEEPVEEEPEEEEPEEEEPEEEEPEEEEPEEEEPEEEEPEEEEPEEEEPEEEEPEEEEPEEEEPEEEEPVEEDPVVPIVVPPAGSSFYSGDVITGPEFCANFSLGGPRLYPHDSNGDGIADVCSLPHTRREAIARQNAVIALANQHPDIYTTLVNAACAATAGTSACGGDPLSAPPSPPPAGDRLYSGDVITGPGFCANRSLGGPTTYPHDSNGDGIADVCSLPYTRREAIARQQAGDILAKTFPAQFQTWVQSSCRALATADYGDDPADLAKDACA
ncbi:MAG: fibronectin type III domain-containing protein [bacterium]|nr:fibronectin type III domain-containing protein [bacterium]